MSVSAMMMPVTLVVNSRRLMNIDDLLTLTAANRAGDSLCVTDISDLRK